MNALSSLHHMLRHAARTLATTRRHTLLVLLATVSVCVCPVPAQSAGNQGMERAVVKLLTDPQLFELTPDSAAARLKPFGRLKEDPAGGFTAKGTALRSFFIELKPYGRRAAVYFDRSNDRLTSITLMFSPEDAIDGARVRAALAPALGEAKEWAQAGSNRVVWWDAADGRRVQITLDTPGIEPARVYIASVGRESSDRP